jgi:hypothetical protein
MAEYKLTNSDYSVIRTEDSASIPADEGNRDWVAYQEWLGQGGVPDPYIVPVYVNQPSPEQTLMLDHENRIRAIEGEPPLTMADLLAKMTPK